MFRRYLLTPCYAPPDGAGGGAGSAAGAGGTADAASAGSGTDAGTDGDPDPAATDGADGDAGDGDDPIADPELEAELREREELLAALPPAERDKRVRTWNRRDARKLARVNPIAEVLRDPTTGKFLPREEVERMRRDALDMRELNQFFTENPDVVRSIMERRANGGRRDEAAKPTWQDRFADPEKLPLDMTNPASQFVVEQLRALDKQNFELRQLLEETRRGVGTLHQTDAERRVAAVENTWKTAALSAADRHNLDARERAIFVGSVWKTFELAKARNLLGRVKPDDIIAKELKNFGGARRRAVADTTRRATHATTVPRPAGAGHTAAAGPRETNRQAGTIKDARRSFFDRLGQSAPPR
jgi:hypothetical protein